jgi:hypothetical protein
VGVVTLGWGWNFQRGDTEVELSKLGGSWPYLAAAPVAKDSDPENAVAACITQAQADSLFEIALAPLIGQARASLSPGIFDALSDPRRFVIVDLTYNMGAGSDGWGGFNATQGLIAQGQRLKDQGQLVQAHQLFMEAGSHLKGSSWYGQVGARAQRDVAMLVAGEWADPNGNGSDIAA